MSQEYVPLYVVPHHTHGVRLALKIAAVVVLVVATAVFVFTR